MSNRKLLSTVTRRHQHVAGETKDTVKLLKEPKRRGVTIVESAIVLSVTMFMILASLELAIVTIRQNALCEGARRACRYLALRGKQSSVLGDLGPESLELTLDDAAGLTTMLRPAMVTMNPEDVSLTVDWMDGDNEVNNRVQVLLSYRHESSLPFLSFMDNHELWASSIRSIAH